MSLSYSYPEMKLSDIIEKKIKDGEDEAFFKNLVDAETGEIVENANN